jgi:hypothetical protein
MEDICAKERENNLKTICMLTYKFNIIDTFCVEYACASFVKSFNLHLLDGHEFKLNDSCFTSTFAFQFERIPPTRDTILASLLYCQYEFHQKRNWLLEAGALLITVPASSTRQSLSVKDAMLAIDKQAKSSYNGLVELYDGKSKFINLITNY